MNYGKLRRFVLLLAQAETTLIDELGDDDVTTRAAAQAPSTIVRRKKQASQGRHTVTLKLKLTEKGRRRPDLDGRVVLEVRTTISARQGKEYALRDRVTLLRR